MRKMIGAAVDWLFDNEAVVHVVCVILGLLALFTMGWLVSVLITFGLMQYAAVAALVLVLVALSWGVGALVLFAVDELTRGQ